MPVDASDRLRRINDIAVFKSFVIQKQIQQPGVGVSTCQGFNGTSTIRNFGTFNRAYDIEQGRVYFSTCQAGSNSQ